MSFQLLQKHFMIIVLHYLVGIDVKDEAKVLAAHLQTTRHFGGEVG